MVAIIAALLGLIVPSVNSMWRESKNAETEQMLTGALAATRAQAYHNKQRGLFFMLDGDVQKIYPIEAEPPDPTIYTDPAVTHEDTEPAFAVTDGMAANRFKISDGKVITLSKPFRVVPRAVVDVNTTGATADTWEADEINRQDYAANLASNELQRHRNFFTMVFSTDGQLLVGLDVLIHDPDSFLDESKEDEKGDRTALEVGDPNQWYTRTGLAQIGPVASSKLPHMLVDEADVAMNFPSVDGLLVYDDSSFMEQPTADLRRKFLLDTGQPLYVSRLSGAVIRGPLGENE